MKEKTPLGLWQPESFPSISTCISLQTNNNDNEYTTVAKKKEKRINEPFSKVPQFFPSRHDFFSEVENILRL